MNVILNMAASIAARHEAIRRVTTPLPGSEPRENYKPINVPQDSDGATMLEALGRMVKQLPQAYWEEECARGLVVNLEREPVAATQIVRAGERYRHLFPNVTEPDVNGRIEILHEDEALIVVNKPAPLPMHAGGRFYRNTPHHIRSSVVSLLFNCMVPDKPGRRAWSDAPCQPPIQGKKNLCYPCPSVVKVASFAV